MSNKQPKTIVIEKKHKVIRFDIRPTFDGLWLRGVEIEMFGIGLRIQLYNYRYLGGAK